MKIGDVITLTGNELGKLKKILPEGRIRKI